jgi:hypothetical protein
MGTEAPLKNFRETDSWLIRGILLSSFLSAVGALCGVAVLGKGRKRTTQRRREPRGEAETEDDIHRAGEWSRNAAFPLTVFPLVFPCLYYVTHADLRFRHPLDPVVLLLTAIAMGAAFRRFAGRDGIAASEASPAP